MAEFRQLDRFRKRAAKQFLTPFLTASSIGAAAPDEELAVAAFAMLLHGALENYVEGLCLWLAGRVEQSWQQKQRLSVATASLLLAQKPQSSSTVPSSTFDRIRLALEQSKEERSRVVEKNNGVALEHLRELLEPLGVRVPGDPVRVASLELLVSIRHQWAHQYRFSAKRSKSAGDLSAIADDCLELARDLATSAVTLRA